MTSCTFQIIKRDTNSKEQKKLLEAISKSYVKVGIQEEEFNKPISKNFTQGRNAVLQEFGGSQTVEKTRRFMSHGKWFYLKKGTTIKTPPRVFIRIFSVFTKHRQALQGEMHKMVNIFLSKSKNSNTFWNNIGVFTSNVMKDRIIEGVIEPKNAPMTIEAKGNNNALYDTGSLMKDIKSKVVK
jgi:hypothetical protein